MRRLHLVFTLLLLAMPAMPAFAMDLKPIDLGKNLDIWFAEDHTVPIVTLTVSLPAGSVYDPADKPGLANFAASLMDEGAGNLNARAFHAALADRAIQFRADTERDYTVITIVTLKENLPVALHLLQLALTHPRFDNDAVARVRTQIIQSLEEEETEPPRVAAHAFMKAFFNGHPYGHPTDGEVAGVFGVTTEDLRAFARSHWTKGGMKIAIAGDITLPAVAKLLGQTLQPVSGAVPPPPPPVGRLGEPGIHVVPMTVPQPTVMFGLPGIMRSDPEFLAGYIANDIVGGGDFSSRLMNEVRVKRGLTYGVSTALNAYRRASVMAGAVATRADAVRQTIAVVKATLADFAANGPTQQELDDAKTYITGSFPLAFSSDAGIAAQLGAYQRQGLDIGYVARRNALIDAVTLDEVKKAAKRLFDPARLTVVVAGTPTQGNAPQRPKAPVRPTPTAPVPGTAPAAGARPNATAPRPAPGRPGASKPMVAPPAAGKSNAQQPGPNP